MELWKFSGVKCMNRDGPIVYISSLETEIYLYQNQMGFLVSEKQDGSTNFENLKASVNSVGLNCEFDQVAHISTKGSNRERILQNALQMEKECVTNMKQRLKLEDEVSLDLIKSKLEADLHQKYKLMVDELEVQRQVLELREKYLNQKAEMIGKKECDIELKSQALMKLEEEIVENLKLQEKKQNLVETELENEMEKIHILENRDEMQNAKLEMFCCKKLVEDEKEQALKALEMLKISKNDKNNLIILELRLKEELNTFRGWKLDLLDEEKGQKIEKEKFKEKWELIDEKRKEIQRGIELVLEEREAVSRFLESEQKKLKLERESLRDKFENDNLILSCEREELMKKMAQERSELFSMMQQEREHLIHDFEIKKMELECSVSKMKEEIEGHLKEKINAFEKERSQELQHISSQKELIAREYEHITLTTRRLDEERKEIVLDRQRRLTEWLKINKFVLELNKQREKLKNQGQLLHEANEEISIQTQHLNKFEDPISLNDVNLDSNKSENAFCLIDFHNIESEIYLNLHRNAENGKIEERKFGSDMRNASNRAPPLMHGRKRVNSSSFHDPIAEHIEMFKTHKKRKQCKILSNGKRTYGEVHDDVKHHETMNGPSRTLRIIKDLNAEATTEKAEPVRRKNYKENSSNNTTHRPDSDGEIEEADEEPASFKAKVWNFLIT